jgi:hypothetical protein
MWLSLRREVANIAGTPNMRGATGYRESPLYVATEIVASMCRQSKEEHWIGVCMENFLRAAGTRMDGTP